MKLGMTGNRYSISAKALELFKNFLWKIEVSQAHHGDCVGADATFHAVVTAAGIHTVVHPPDQQGNRAFCVGKETRLEKPYLVRNHNIVDETDMLVAFPSTKEEVKRSGTWATIRYARKQKKKILLIYPDGTNKIEK